MANEHTQKLPEYLKAIENLTNERAAARKQLDHIQTAYNHVVDTIWGPTVKAQTVLLKSARDVKTQLGKLRQGILELLNYIKDRNFQINVLTAKCIKGGYRFDLPAPTPEPVSTEPKAEPLAKVLQFPYDRQNPPNSPKSVERPELCVQSQVCV